MMEAVHCSIKTPTTLRGFSAEQSRFQRETRRSFLERKWYTALVNGIFALYTAVSHRITERVTELADRYEHTLPELERDVAAFESKVKSHLERMGFVW